MSVVSNTISLPLLPLVSGILGNLLKELEKGREDEKSREEREEKGGGGDEERDGTGNEEVRSREEKDVG